MITKERCYCVYKHIFPNNKVYIGITCKKPIYRWNNGNGYKKTSSYMYNAIKKYGWENIKHEILFEGLTKQDAENKEIELIKLYKSNDCKFGYNLMSGGHCSRHGELTKQQISKHSKGKKLSEKTKEQISKTMKLLYKDGIPERRKKILRCNDKKIYDSITQASIELNIPTSNIVACCKGKRKTAGGYVWQYQNKD